MTRSMPDQGISGELPVTTNAHKILCSVALIGLFTLQCETADLRSAAINRGLVSDHTSHRARIERVFIITTVEAVKFAAAQNLFEGGVAYYRDNGTVYETKPL